MEQAREGKVATIIAPSVGATPVAVLGHAKEYFRLTQLGNAERLVRQWGHQILHCHAWKKWLIWNGRQWAPDNDGMIHRLATLTVRSIYNEAALAEEEESRTAIAKHAKKSESKGEIEAMIDLARHEVPITPQQLDISPWLFNCQNGTIDLHTGELRKHNPAERLSKISPVAFDPGARCPTWIAFLGRIFAGDEGLVTFMQRVIGYSLTGEVTEKALFVLHGGGNNGKTTLLEAVRYIMGDYAGVVDINALMRDASTADRQRTVADLLGKRFVTSSETEEGHKLNEAMIKNLTGMGRQVGRRIYGSAFEFDPHFKLFIDANHKPVIRGTDQAIWNRIRLMPFDVAIPKEQQDKGLLQKLRAEAPGILAWAVQGCLAWQKAGELGSPKAMNEAVASYREEMDIVAEFVAECCEVEEGVEESAANLYLAFQQWCEKRKEAVISSTALGRRLDEKGYLAARSSGVRKRRGLRLKEEAAVGFAQRPAA
jgi:putative DNA primase/helicase